LSRQNDATQLYQLLKHAKGGFSLRSNSGGRSKERQAPSLDGLYLLIRENPWICDRNVRRIAAKDGEEKEVSQKNRLSIRQWFPNRKIRILKVNKKR